MPIPTYKEIWELIKKGATVEAQEKIMELRESCISLEDEVDGLKRKVRGLEDALRFKEELEFRAPFYFRKGDAEPYCPRCWEKERHAIHVAPERAVTGVRARACPECKAEFKTGNVQAGIVSVTRR